MSRNGQQYIVRPTGSGRTAHLTVSGRTGDGRAVPLKRVEYRVLNLPDPTLYWGATKAGGRIPVGDTRIFMKYGPSIPLDARFTIERWEMSAGTQPVGGTGNNVSPATGLIRAMRPGMKVAVTCWVRGPDGILRTVSGVFKK